jgi:hypothetical protein
VTAAVRSAPPPRWLVRCLLNPVMRPLVRSPLGRWTGAVVTIRFTGRRTGRVRDVVALGYEVGGELTVFTDRPWALNFRGGRTVTVGSRGRRFVGVGRLIEDGRTTAEALCSALERACGPRLLGLRVAPGRPPAVDDLVGLRRAVRFTLDPG